MKKSIAFLLAVLCLLCMTGCSSAAILTRVVWEGIQALSESSADTESSASDYEDTFVSETPETPTVSSGEIRDFYTDVSSADTVTVMLYIVGSDLESEVGYATADLNEILAASVGDNVNVVFQIGGAEYWWNDRVRSTGCHRYLSRGGELVWCESAGDISMADPDTLSSFIRWSAENYPAERYQLILWNHGGGTMDGFGYDEFYPGDMMTVSEIADALRDGGVQFDFVGFDACLMGTMEVAMAVEPYADYLIASEELEPSGGWSYTGWLTALENTPGIPTDELGDQITRDFIASYTAEDDPSLSVLDLRYIRSLYDAMEAYFSAAYTALDDGQYLELSHIRAEVREFGEYEFDQIDLYDLLTLYPSSDAETLQRAYDNVISSSVDYDSRGNGIALYFPYNYPEYYDSVRYEMTQVGFEESYFRFFDAFINILAYGQNNQSTFGFLSLDGFEHILPDFSEYDWFAPEDDLIENNYTELTTDELYLIDKGDYFALSLSEETWDIITYIEMQVLLDDGEDLIDLGCDNVYEFDDDGDLIVDFDYYWVALDGITVPFYAEEESYTDDEYWYTYGYVPAELNGTENIEIILRWDANHPDGYVAGYRSADFFRIGSARGLRQFVPGDSINYLCDCYDYDYNYIDSYYLGEPVIWTDTPFTVEYIEIGDYRTETCFMLRDIYNNEYWTETVEITFE